MKNGVADTFTLPSGVLTSSPVLPVTVSLLPFFSSFRRNSLRRTESLPRIRTVMLAETLSGRSVNTTFTGRDVP